MLTYLPAIITTQDIGQTSCAACAALLLYVGAFWPPFTPQIHPSRQARVTRRPQLIYHAAKHTRPFHPHKYQYPVFIGSIYPEGYGENAIFFDVGSRSCSRCNSRIGDNEGLWLNSAGIIQVMVFSGQDQ